MGKVAWRRHGTTIEVSDLWANKSEEQYVEKLRYQGRKTVFRAERANVIHQMSRFKTLILYSLGCLRTRCQIYKIDHGDL